MKQTDISTEEALRLLAYSSMENVVRVHELQKAFESNLSEYVRSGYTWEQNCLLNYIYQAGRIDGIREERARRQK